MTNNQGLLNDLEFEKHIGEMADRQLLEFVARQTYDMNLMCAQHKALIEYNTGRITALESGAKKQSSVTGGVTGAMAAIVIAVVNYFVNRS